MNTPLSKHLCFNSSGTEHLTYNSSVRDVLYITLLVLDYIAVSCREYKILTVNEAMGSSLAHHALS